MLFDGVRRIAIAGPSGSGKTTLAAELGGVLGLPHVEIDGLHWRAGWTANPAFEDEVRAFAATDAWVTEFQYRRALPVLAARADLVVLLRLPRALVLRRVVGRTLHRRWTREPMWGVNVEPPLRTILTDRDHIVRWSMRTFREAERRVRAAEAARPALPVVVVRSRRDAARLLVLAAAAR